MKWLENERYVNRYEMAEGLNIYHRFKKVGYKNELYCALYELGQKIFIRKILRNEVEPFLKQCITVKKKKKK